MESPGGSSSHFSLKAEIMSPTWHHGQDLEKQAGGTCSGDPSLYQPLLGATGHGPSPHLLGVKGSISTVVPDTTRAAKTSTLGL